MPYVSIIVPVYNVLPYLCRCVSSLTGQSFDNIELILVDDGSTDGSGELCDILARDDPRIRVIHKQNGGLSDARNCGLDAARGDYITFVDSDDFVTSDYVRYLLSLFGYSPKSNVAACAHFVVRDKKCKVSTRFSGRTVLCRRDVYRHLLYHDIVDVCAWAKLYRKSVFDSLRFPVGRLYEDTYLFSDVMSRTESIVFGGRPQYFYIMREGSIVNGGFCDTRLEYLDATERLVGNIMSDPSLERGCIRRLSHARLSVFRYMENCGDEYLAFRRRLRRQILATAPSVLFDKNTPSRHRIALLLITLGTSPFYYGWRIYERVRG